jgi:hypothetical protein
VIGRVIAVQFIEWSFASHHSLLLSQTQSVWKHILPAER